MASVLAYADTTDPSQLNFLVLLTAVLLIGAVCVLTFLVVFLARSRGHRQAESILVLALFWACLTGGSFVYSAVSRLKWSQENTLRLETGYGNPQDNSDAPQFPWLAWLALAVGYGMLIMWAASQNNSPPSSSGQVEGGESGGGQAKN
jgi:hypothetical protein